MSDGVSVFRRLAGRTFLTCVRELIRAVVAVAGIPLFFVSVFSVISLSAGIGVVLAPKSLLTVRRLAWRVPGPRARKWLQRR